VLLPVCRYLWYRLVMNDPMFAAAASSGSRILLHFDAVDWQTQAFVNRKLVGNHTGGYEQFTFDITDDVVAGQDNELFVSVYDPSDEGFQPNGKQRISAITNPGGDTYTPSSGIWQTVRFSCSSSLPLSARRAHYGLTQPVGCLVLPLFSFCCCLLLSRYGSSSCPRTTFSDCASPPP